MKSKLLLSFATLLSLTACSNQPKTCQASKAILVRDAGVAVKKMDDFVKSFANAFGANIKEDDKLAVFLDITDIKERDGEKNKDTVCLCSAKVKFQSKEPGTDEYHTHEVDFDYSLKKDEQGKKTIVDVDASDIFAILIKGK